MSAILFYVVVIEFLLLSGLYRRQYYLRVDQTCELLEQTRRANEEHGRAAALDERTRIARERHGSRAGQGAGGGHGIAGMRERVALVGGSLRAEEREGSWTVTAEVPA